MPLEDQGFAEFDHVVTSAHELEELIGVPPPEVLAKVVDHLDDVCRQFIARSPFCIIASAGPDGPVDLSPKGDPPGFVRVLDRHQLAIPDRPGNRRIDTFHNVLREPRVGIIFLVPGTGETLRVSGTARIVRDDALLATMAVQGKLPKVALVVRVDRAFVHCPKCVTRSGLWRPESWSDGSLPDIGEAMIRQGQLDTTPEALFAEAERSGLTKLY